MLSDRSESAQVLDQLPLPVLLPIMLQYITRARIREMKRVQRQKRWAQKSRNLKRVIPKPSSKERQERALERRVNKPSLFKRISKFFGLTSPILTVVLAIYNFFAPTPAPTIVVTPVYGEQSDSTNDYLFNQKKLEKLLQYLEPLLLHMNNVIANAVATLNAGGSQASIKSEIIEHLANLKQEYNTHSSTSLTVQVEQKQMIQRVDVLIAVLKLA